MRICVILDALSVWQAKGFNLRVESLCYLLSTDDRCTHQLILKSTTVKLHLDTSLVWLAWCNWQHICFCQTDSAGSNPVANSVVSDWFY